MPAMHVFLDVCGSTRHTLYTIMSNFQDVEKDFGLYIIGSNLILISAAHLGPTFGTFNFVIRGTRGFLFGRRFDRAGYGFRG